MSKKALVIGLQKSGLAAYNLLVKMGYDVTVSVNNVLSDSEKTLIPLAELNDGGHDLQLAQQKWDIVVKNPGIPYHVAFIQELILNNNEIISEIELAYEYQPNSTYLALTGTNGKTTTTTLLFNILKQAYNNTLLAGNIGYPLAQLVLDHPNENIFCLELSSFQLMGIKKFKPAIASIINLAPDHLDYMKNVEDYYESKQSIYQNQDENDYFILNKDDKLVQKYLDNCMAKIITYSIKEKADFYVSDNYIVHNNQQLLDLSKLKVVGEHNIYNVMVALIYAYLMKVELELIQKAIYEFTGVEYRLQKVEGIKNNIYYNDSKATTPDSTITALKTFKTEPLILIMGGFDKGLDFSELIEVINQKNNIFKVYLYGQINNKIKGLKKNVCIFDDLNQVMQDILSNYDNKTVLFSCATSSYDQYKNYEQRGEHFNKLIKG